MKILETTQFPHSLDLRLEAGLLRVDVLNERALRVRYSLQATFSTDPGLLLPQPPADTPWTLEEDSDSLALSTSALRLEIDKHSGAFTWRDASGGLLLREPARGGKTIDPVEFTGCQAFATRLDLVFAPDEALYGLGQHEDGVFNYRGHSELLYQHNMKVAMPVLVSTRGYALFFNCASLAAFHDDPHGSYFWCDAVDELDFTFLYGPEFDALVAGIRQLTGRPTMLPKWSYGYVQSKERYKTQDELVAIAQEYRQRGIGLDCIVLDWMSWPGKLWGQKTLDSERFPNPARMMTDLHALNTRLMVSVWPKFSNDGPDQVEMRAVGGLLSDGVTYDAFNPTARAVYWQQANRGLFQHGIDAWWCDCTEPFEPDWTGTIYPEPSVRAVNNAAEFKRHLDPRRINAFSLKHSQGMYEGQRAETDEKRVINLTRSGFPGQVRYGTITWSGDLAARWDVFKKQIPAGLNFTVTGSPRWTFDIGAFFVKPNPAHWFWNADFPDGVDDPGYRELYARWFQMGAFLPMFRAHGADTPREVWRFGKPGEPVYDTLVKFIRLRYRLLPYIYSLAAWETQRDYTMLRSLAFDFRDDPYVHNISDQFMLGPALMVCPVTEPQKFGPNGAVLDERPTDRAVYLPAGCDWYNFWTGKRYAGGQLLRTPAPIDILPLFVRAGSILPLGPDVQHSGQQAGQPLELRIYPGRSTTFDLYEDEGDSYRYEQGQFAFSLLSWDEPNKTLTIDPRRGSYPGMPAQQVFNLTLAAPGVEPGPAVGQLTQEGGSYSVK